MWSMDQWQYLERQAITDPKGRQWSIAVMDLLGQEGDPDMPNEWTQLQYASGRYFTLIYSESGSVQWEKGHASLPDAMQTYEQLLARVFDGRLDPAQPVFRATLDDE
jgi:hypothetical protein